MQTNTTLSFRSHLREELLRRCKKNPGYSLRAFSRSLVIDPSSLAKILKGERAISKKMCERLGARLNLSPKEISELSNSNTHAKLKNFDSLSLDVFAIICDWYHFAILEVVKIDGFKSNTQWIAKRLGLTATEVNLAVERLIRLGLLENKNGSLVSPVKNRSVLKGRHTSAAERKLQKQILEMALAALEEVPIEKRSQSSMTMAVHTKRLPEAVERIHRFQRELSAILEQDSSRNEVYQLSISLYPLTTCKEKPTHEI